MLANPNPHPNPSPYPHPDQIAEIRKHLGTLRQRYISIWQLVLLAGLMQALLHYVSSTGLEPLDLEP